MLEIQCYVNSREFKQAYETMSSKGVMNGVLKYNSTQQLPLPVHFTESLSNIKQQILKLDCFDVNRELINKAGCLEIIRFVSKLADMYTNKEFKQSNKSISSVLGQPVLKINHSEILAEIRHSITHKEIPDDRLIISTIDQIQNYLDQQYWKIKLKQLHKKQNSIRSVIQLQLDSVTEIHQTLTIRQKTELNLANFTELDSILISCLDYLIGLADFHIIDKTIAQRILDRKLGERQMSRVANHILLVLKYYKVQQKSKKYNNLPTIFNHNPLSNESLFLLNKLSIISYIKPVLNKFMEQLKELFSIQLKYENIDKESTTPQSETYSDQPQKKRKTLLGIEYSLHLAISWIIIENIQQKSIIDPIINLMSKQKQSITQMKGQLEKKFQEAYGNNPQNQTIINYIVKELAGEQVRSINLQSAMNKKYSDMVQSKQSKMIQQKEQRTTKFVPDGKFPISTKSEEFSDKGKSNLNVDSQTWEYQAKLLDEQQRILDIEKAKNLKKQQLELIQQLNIIKSDKKNKADAEKKSEFRWAEQQQALKKQSRVNKEAKAKQSEEELRRMNQYLEDQKKLKKRERKLQIHQEKQEIAKMLKQMKMEEEQQKVKELGKQLEMQQILKQYEQVQVKQKNIQNQEKEEDRKMMKQYSEQLKHQEKLRDQQKQERGQKIERITNQYAATVEKDLQQKIRMEEAKIQKQLDQQNMKYDKEQERKQKQLKQKQQEMLEELEQQKKFKEQMKLREKLEDQCYGKEVQAQIKIDEKKSNVKREAKQKQLLAATDHLKEQIIFKQNNKPRT